MIEECEDCKFYKRFRCHRYPPQMRHNGEFRFPCLPPDDWCGEFVRAASDKIGAKAENLTAEGM